MARFKFRLTTLLRMREALRNDRRAQLAEAFAAEQKLRARRAALAEELRELNRAYRMPSHTGQIDLERLLNANRYEVIVKAEIQLIDTHAATLEVEIEKRRQALVAADADVRILEKLRETQQTRHRQNEGLLEQKGLDEIAGRRIPAEEVA